MSFTPHADLEPRPKQWGAVLGLYDKPVYRDWLVYWTFFWTIFSGLVIAFPTSGNVRTTSMPTWLNALLAGLFFGAALGLLPAYVRLLIRRARLRRRRMQAEPTTGAAEPPNRAEPQSPAPAPAWTAAPGGTQTRPDRSAPPAAATPIQVLDLSSIRESDLLIGSRQSLPYPIARAVRSLQQAGSAKESYETVLRTSETLSTVLGIVATVWARQNGVVTPALTKLHEAFLSRGVSQGTWIDVAQSIERPMREHGSPIAGMADALKSHRGTGLLPDLRDLVAERNRWAHGGGPHNNIEAGERLSELMPALERALGTVAFLSQSSWLLVNDVKLRRREGDFQISAARAMGDHPDFDQTTLTAPQPLAEDIFYLLSADAFLDMTPLVVMRPCPTCHQREVSFADRVDARRGVSLKTFDRGHVLFDPSLVDDIRYLLPENQAGAEGEAG